MKCFQLLREFWQKWPYFRKKWPEFCGLVLTENVVACPVSKVPHAESGLWHVKKKSYTNEISSVPVLQCPSGLVLQCSNDPVLQSVEAWASRLTSRSCLIGIRLASHSIFLAGWLKLKVLFYWLQFKNSTTIFSHIFSHIFEDRDLLFVLPVITFKCDGPTQFQANRN